MPTTITLDADVARLWMAACLVHRTLGRVDRLSGGEPPGRWEPGEVHVVPTLCVCLEGVVRLEGLADRHVDLAPGAALLIPPGTWHRHAPLRRGSASISQGFLLGRSDIELDIPGRQWWVSIPEQPSRSLLERACTATTANRLSLIRESLAGLAGEAACPVAPMSDAVRRMWMCLRRERLTPIGAADILRASGLGPTRAHLAFRSYFGETPHRLLIRHRLEHVRHLLSQGVSVSDAAARSGFRTRHHLTAAFRQAFGVPPTRWQTV